MSDSKQEADKQVFETLISDEAISAYISHCARLCWKMMVQRPSMRFDASGRYFFSSFFFSTEHQQIISLKKILLC